MRSATPRELVLPLLLVLVAAVPGLAQDHAAVVPAFLRHEHITVDTDPRSIERLCRTGREVRACTDFVAEQFKCGCIEREGKWSISASLEFEVVIYAIDVRYLQHERQHLLDIEHALPGALDRFTSLQMPDRAVCENLAAVMSAPSFARDVMNRLRKASNERLGCETTTRQRKRQGTLVAAVHPPR